MPRSRKKSPNKNNPRKTPHRLPMPVSTRGKSAIRTLETESIEEELAVSSPYRAGASRRQLRTDSFLDTPFMHVG